MNIDFTLLRSFYHISPEGADHPSFEMPAADFLHPDKAREAMLELGKLYRAVGMELPVSFTGMTFFNLCMTRLLANAQSDRPLRLALTDLTFQLEQHDDHAHAGYRVDKLVGLEPPEDPRLRESFGRDSWIGLFRDTITPAVEAVAAAAGYKPAMIWNQFGAQIHSVRQYVHDYLGAQQPGLPELFDREFRLLESLPAEAFNRSRNPFVHTPRYIDNPWSPPEGRYILRSACCMYDRRENGEKCYNCPNMRPEEREERRKLALAGQ